MTMKEAYEIMKECEVVVMAGVKLVKVGMCLVDVKYNNIYILGIDF